MFSFFFINFLKLILLLLLPHSQFILNTKKAIYQSLNRHIASLIVNIKLYISLYIRRHLNQTSTQPYAVFLQSCPCSKAPTSPALTKAILDKIGPNKAEIITEVKRIFKIRLLA